MTKLLLPLFFIFISLSSCSSDDDAVNEQNIDEQGVVEQDVNESDDNSTTVDPLVGEWKLLRSIETENVGEDGKERVVSDEGPNECDLMELFIINSDNTGLLTGFGSSSSNGVLVECTFGSTTTIENWVNNKDGTYTLSGNVKEENVDADIEEGSFEDIVTFTFSDDLTTHSTTASEDQTYLGRGTVTFENIYIRQ